MLKLLRVMYLLVLMVVNRDLRMMELSMVMQLLTTIQQTTVLSMVMLYLMDQAVMQVL